MRVHTTCLIDFAGRVRYLVDMRWLLLSLLVACSADQRPPANAIDRLFPVRVIVTLPVMLDRLFQIAQAWMSGVPATTSPITLGSKQTVGPASIACEDASGVAFEGGR